MPTYIEDEETSRLIDQYAALVANTKTGALRDLLRREIPKLIRPAGAEDRLKRMQEFHRQYPPNPDALPNTRETYDSLYEFIADEQARVEAVKDKA